MYSEGNSKEEILSRMLEKVPNDLLKSEGTFLYDANSPVSIELEESYKTLDDFLEKVFAITSYGIFLEMRAAELGIFRKEGTKAITKGFIFEGADGTVIPQGTIVQTPSGLEYSTNADTTILNGKAITDITALNIGSQYIVPSNAITELPVSIVGVTKCYNPNSCEGGTNIEDDASLKERYFMKVQQPSTSGNKFHYQQWALEVPGIGGAKIFPLWSGNGTVKVVVIDSNKKGANTELIDAVRKHIEDKKPIGAMVTVIGAIEKKINITAKVVLANNYNISTVYQEFLKNIDICLKDLVFKESYISYAKIGSILLGTQGVLDYTDLKINDDIKNIGLQDEEIPVLGTVELGV